jgi:hypothetical protein
MPTQQFGSRIAVAEGFLYVTTNSTISGSIEVYDASGNGPEYPVAVLDVSTYGAPRDVAIGQ